MSNKLKDKETTEYLEKNKAKQKRRSLATAARDKRSDVRSIKESRWN